MKEFTITLASFNIRGLKDFTKRNQFLNYIRTQRFDIVAVQETHLWDDFLVKTIESEWEGKSIFVKGEKRSKGITLFLGLNTQCIVINKQEDIEGRILSVDLKINQNKIRLIIVYFSNNSSSLHEEVDRLGNFFFTSYPIVLMGDFNFILDEKLDHINFTKTHGIGATYPTLVQEFKKLMNIASLIDVFREINPNTNEFTCYNIPTKTGTRIDRIHISKTLYPQVKHFEHRDLPFSDHRMILIKIKLGDSITGPGYWKCNVTTLEDKDFVNDLECLIKGIKEDEIDDNNNFWNDFKKQVKELIMIHSSRLNKNRKKIISQIELKIKQATDPIRRQELMQDIKNELDFEYQGKRIRAKVDELNNRDKSTKTLLAREKGRAQRKIIEKLIVDNKEVTTLAELKQICYDHFKNRLTEPEGEKEGVGNFMEGMKRLDNDDAGICEGEISVEECRMAIKQMKKDKSPGEDGLPCEFYKKFFELFAHLFLKVIKNSLRNQKLPTSMRTGIISLLPKEGTDLLCIESWRPITLLNVDYKIISKVIVNRLRQIIEKLVGTYQTGAIPNRSIQNNLLLLRDTINYCGERNISSFLFTIDQEKAFDMVRHDFLFEVLHNLGFGNDFIKFVKLLYNEIITKVYVNKDFTLEFLITRSLHQGCGLSPGLYILCIEVLLYKIYSSILCKGISTPLLLTEVKIFAHADDTTCIFSNINSLDFFEEIYNQYSKISGSKLNKNKCAIMPIKRYEDKDFKDFPYKITNFVKICGVYFGQNSIKLNEQQLIKKVDRVIAQYQFRRLALYTRATIINVVILAQVWYVLSICRLSTEFIKQLNRKIFKFLWKSTEWISRKTLIAEFQEGGLEIIDIQTRISAIEIKNLLCTLTMENNPHRDIILYWLALPLRKLIHIESLNLFPKATEPDKIYKPLVPLVKKVHAEWGNKPLEEIKLRHIYHILLKDIYKEPKIVTHFYSPNNIDHRQIFNNLKKSFLSNEARDLVFKIIHDILPLKLKLTLYKIINNMGCTFCNKYQETIDHLFFKCDEIKLAYNAMLELTGFRSLSEDNIRRGSIFESSNPYFTSVIVGEYLYNIWLTRNQVNFNKASFNKKQILDVFLVKIKNRIKMDQRRFIMQEFQKRWGNPKIKS